jgi:hypothetical protein
VQERLLRNSSLQTSDFHPQWYLNNPETRPPIDPILLLRDPVKIRVYGKDNGKKGPRELIQVERAREATAVRVRKEAPQPAYDYIKVPRQMGFRTIRDLIQHLPKQLAHGPSFQAITRDEVTENRGLEDLFPEPYWVDEYEDIRLAPETYRLCYEIGSTRNRHIHELRYRREERVDIERMRQAARQAHREQHAATEAKERAVLQELRRSDRGRIPSKRNRDL